MEHVSFIVWILAYPLMVTVDEVIRAKAGIAREHSADARGFAALIHLIIWISVGVALF